MSHISQKKQVHIDTVQSHTLHARCISATTRLHQLCVPWVAVLFECCMHLLSFPQELFFKEGRMHGKMVLCFHLMQFISQDYYWGERKRAQH